MNYHINIKEIAENAKANYRDDVVDGVLADATMVDIADYTAWAVNDFVEDFIEEMRQDLCDIVEQEIQGW